MISLDSRTFDRANSPLEGPRVRLEPLREAHATVLFPLLDDPALYTWIDHGPPASLQRLQAVYRQLEDRRSPDGRELWLNWVAHAGDAALGYVQASVQADGRAWVAYVLARAAWGQGYASEAVATMLQHLFSVVGVQQAMAMVEQDNARSIHLLRRLGFRPAAEDERRDHTMTATERLWLLDVTPANRLASRLA